MYFFSYPQDFKERSLPSAPGSLFRIVWGERVMLQYSTLQPNSRFPLNSHPHEQTGMVIEGELTQTIGDETRLCKKGDAFTIPSNVKHSSYTGDQITIVLEAFCPVREDYIKMFTSDTQGKG
jgi:quercetin dioxygenase-like cupin family protein